MPQQNTATLVTQRAAQERPERATNDSLRGSIVSQCNPLKANPNPAVAAAIQRNEKGFAGVNITG